jgi:tetratricopeptide (TPR) repeat protein
MRVTSVIALTGLLLGSALPAAAAPTTRPSFGVESDLDLAAALVKDKDLPTALDLYQSILRVEPDNVTAMHGAALCQLQLGKPDEAIPLLERAVRSPKTNRAVANNLAAVRLKTGDAIRALKVLTEQLQRDPTIDEPLTDALWIALDLCDEKDKRNRQYAQSLAVWKSRQLALEQQPGAAGMSKFGCDWIAVDQLRDIEASNKELSATLTTHQTELAAQQQELARLEALRADRKKNRRIVDGGDWEMQQIESQIDACNKLIGKHESQVRKLTSQLRLPRKIESIPLLAMTDIKPPALTRQTIDQSIERAAKAADVAADQPAAAPGQQQSFAAGFAISPTRIVTSDLTVRDATSITITLPGDHPIAATFVRADAEIGLAIIEVAEPMLSPLSLAPTWDGSAASVWSFPALSLFQPAPQSLSVRGTRENDQWTLKIDKSPGLSAGPVVLNGQVVGVLMADRFDIDPPVRLISAESLRVFVADDSQRDLAPSTDAAASVVLVTATRNTPK